jgi:predicted transcriptional regulator
MNYIANQHIIILILIIILIGSLAGISNFLNYQSKITEKNKDISNNKIDLWKYIVSGIGASILVPLLLNMLSSNLIKETENFEQINYFVFAGFCFVAGYFSERFINSMGAKILKDLEETNEKVDKAISTVKDNEEKIDFIVDTESESDNSELEHKIELNDLVAQNSFADDDFKTQTDKIIKSFLGKYRFRTAKNISKELNYSITIVEVTLEQLQKNGITKKFTTKNNVVLWGLTKIGTTMAEKPMST